MIYQMLGMTVQSAFDLPAAPGDGPPDLIIGGEPPRVVPDGPPAGTLIAGGVEPLITWVARREDGSVLTRIPTFAEFTVMPGLSRATIAVDPARDPGVASVLASGTLPSVVLGLRGVASLHASAVATDDGAILFAGHSGMGKSTLAALLCGAGARLLTDDLVCLDTHDRVLPGATHVRLREAAMPLAHAIPDATSHTTADQRLAVAPAAQSEPSPVAAVMIAHPDRTIRSVQASRLPPAAAAAALMEFSRVRGWREPVAMQALLSLCSRLARRPVYRVAVPWGPPFDPGTARELLALSDPSKPPR